MPISKRTQSADRSDVWRLTPRLLPLCILFLVVLLSGCAVDPPGPAQSPRSSLGAAARIVRLAKPLQCVPYARAHSTVKIRGNAHTWWRQAAGRYERGTRPRPGAILVLAKTRRRRLGHLAVVRRVVNAREIIVDHANWLNRGRVHLATPVRDVSPQNDWSQVRVWYVPGRQLGRRRYAANGFIYGQAMPARAN